MRLHYTEFMNPTHSEFQLGRSQVVPPFLSYSVTYLRIHTWVVQPHRCEFAEQDTTEASTTQTSIHFKGYLLWTGSSLFYGCVAHYQMSTSFCNLK